MKLIFCLCLGVVLAACAKDQILPTAAKPPTTRAEQVTDTVHGVSIVDPYRWLEGDNTDSTEIGKVTPDVVTWTNAQNSYTREVLDHLPGRADLEARLGLLMEAGSVSPPVVRGNRYFFAKRESKQNEPVIYWREGYKGESRVLIDPTKLDPSGLTTVEWTSPSEDGRRVAYGTYRAGDLNTTLHILDVDTGKVLPFEIPDRTRPAQWLPDGSGFIYRNLKDAEVPYSGQIMFHRTGTERAKDALLFGRFANDDNKKLASTCSPWGSLSRDGHWLLLGCATDTKSNDLWLVNFDDFRRTGRIDKRVVSVGIDGVASGKVVGDTLYVLTTNGSPKGRVVAASVAAPERTNWRDIVPERQDAVIENVSFGKGTIAVTYLKNASNVIDVFDLTGEPKGTLALPGLGSAGIGTEEDRTEAYVGFISFNYPATVFRVDLSKPSAAPELWERPDVPVDPASAVVEQVWYPSKDGTRISMFLVHKKGLTKNGAWPTILTGYGGFNVSQVPTFDATMFQWLDAGGMYAISNLRGGGEYGDAWHEAGMLDKKQNVFDDFLSAADWLIAQSYTSPSKLAILGSSNGGLLIGAAITQRPRLFRAAIIDVPLLDMLRYQRFGMARYWIREYGSAEDTKQFKFLLAYSPYHHVQAGTKYPAVLITTGEHDARVHASHARKMTALLQARTASDPAEQPVLLWVDREASRGQSKPPNLQLRDAVDRRLFVMWQLGLIKTR